MRNPVFDERQRIRASTWNVPRFLSCFEEAIDGGLILPRGLAAKVESFAEEAGSRLEIADERSAGTRQKLTFAGTLTSIQRQAVDELARHELAVLVAPPGAGKTVVACALIAAHGEVLSRTSDGEGTTVDVEIEANWAGRVAALLARG